MLNSQTISFYQRHIENYPIGSLWVDTKWKRAGYYNTKRHACIMILALYPAQGTSYAYVLIEEGKIILLDLWDVDVYYERI